MGNNLILDDYLKKLRLPIIRGIYQKLAQEAGKNNVSYENYLLALVEEETLVREENALKRRIKQAHFPYLKTLESFNFSVCRIDKHKVIQLARSEYIHQRENVILLGEPGLGKTHLAIAPRIEACKKGYRILFSTAAGLINEIKETKVLFRYFATAMIRAGYPYAELHRIITKIIDDSPLCSDDHGLRADPDRIDERLSSLHRNYDPAKHGHGIDLVDKMTENVFSLVKDQIQSSMAPGSEAVHTAAVRVVPLQL